MQKTKQFSFSLGVAFAVACAWASSASADVYLAVDIGPNTQRVAPGFVGLISAPGVGAVADYTNSFTSLTGDPLTITFDDTNQSGADVGNIDWRDRGDSTSGDPYAQLGEDHIKNNGGIIRVTISGLPANLYSMTSFHTDAGFSQAESIRVFANTDGGGFVNTGATGDASVNVAVNALSMAALDASSATFSFTSDGVNPVILVFDATLGSDTEVPLNGFVISTVPEPHSFALLGVVACGYGLRRRWKNRR